MTPEPPARGVRPCNNREIIRPKMPLRTTRTGPDRAAERRLAGRGTVLGQTMLIALAVFAYFAVRALTETDHAAAVHNAERLLSLQGVVAMNVEDRVQAWIIDHDRIVTLTNWIYIYGHWPVIVITLAWLYWRARPHFRILRNAMFISGAIGLIIFALYPVAPPRLGVLDMVDTVAERSTSYRTLQPPGIINRYAALPSLHVGWNLLVGIVLFQAVRHPAVRAVAVAMPILMAFAVVATANHYMIDVLAGAMVALAGLAVARRLGDDPLRTLGIRRGPLATE